VLVFISGSVLKAQVSVVNYSALEKQLNKSVSNTENAKKSTKVKTWTDYVSVLVDVYNVHNEVLYMGMTPTEARLFLSQPNEVRQAQDGADQIENYVYDRITLTFRNGELVDWTETNRLVANPLPLAEDAIYKAIEINTGKSSDVRRIESALEELKTAFEFEAILQYEKENFDLSYNNFAKVIELSNIPELSTPVDDIVIFNAGRVAVDARMFEEAANHFSQLESANYDEPFLYIYLKQAYFETGDTAKGVEIMNKGFNRYPENSAIMIEMINYYLITDQAPEALELLKLAQQREPDNVSYVFAEATLYDRIGEVDLAVDTYKKCLEMDPDLYDAAYNLGVLYYNEAVRLYEEASNTTDNAAAQQLNDDGNDLLRLAIPFMRRASEIDPTDVYSLESLQRIYYRLQMNEEYQEVVNKLESL